MANIYYDIIRNRVVGAVGAAEALSSITHPGLKGQLRELVVRELLAPLLPTDIGIGTGQIISASGKSWSGQEDIVVYDRRLLPPVLFEGSTGVFPVESVLFTIEVKSLLNATELKKAHDNAVTLRDFDYISGCQTASGTVPHTVEKVISTLFAFKTDLTGKEKTELSRYQELCPSHPALRAICVPGSGYWFYDEPDWKPSCDNDKYGMVVRFLAGIMSVYRRIVESRRQPSLSEYLHRTNRTFAEGRMVGEIKVTRDDDPLAQQVIYRATAVDKQGVFHDFRACTEEEAVRGCRDEIHKADNDDE